MVGRHKFGALGDGDEGADIVEEVDEEEDEDDFERAVVDGSADVEMEGGSTDGGEGVGSRLPVKLVEEEAGEHGAKDTDEHECSDAKNLENGDEQETEDGESGLWGAEVAEGDNVGGAGDDNAGVLKADEGDEEADAPADSSVELMRDGGYKALADSGVGEGEKDDSGEEDRAEGGLPRDTHAFDNGIGEVGVETHTGGERERVVGDCAHEDAAEGGAEAGGRGNCADGHSCLTENGRVHEDDVGHRDEGGDAGEGFSTPIGAESGEAEVAFEADADGQR